MKNTATLIDELYREYIVHEELPIDFQIGMQNFLDKLKEVLSPPITDADIQAMAEKEYPEGQNAVNIKREAYIKGAKAMLHLKNK